MYYREKGNRKDRGEFDGKVLIVLVDLYYIIIIVE